MKNHIVFYFCGTARNHERSIFAAKSKKPDLAEGMLREELRQLANKKINNRDPGYRNLLGPIISYDGCNKRTSYKRVNKLYGATAHGTGERAKEALTVIRNILKQNNGQTLKINISGHSRGCISALKLMGYIYHHQLEASDNSRVPIKDRVDIVLDLKDPVPGNPNLFNCLDSWFGTSVTRKVVDMSQYTFIKLAHVSYGNQNGKATVNGFGFQPILPLFSYRTEVIVELLVAKHGSFAEPYAEYPGTFELINANSLQLILDHAGVNDDATNQRLLQLKLDLYKLMLRNNGKTVLTAPKNDDRYLHFDAKISSTGYYTPSSVNTTHLALQKQQGIRLENEFIALEFFAPFYYPYFLSLGYLTGGEEWVNRIEQAIGPMNNYKKYTLGQVFRDKTYETFGDKGDKITKPIFLDIMSAKVMQYRLNKKFTERMLNRYCQEIESGKRSTSVDISKISQVTGRAKGH